MNDTIPVKAGWREWIALAVLALPTLLVSIDVYVLLLALPQLTADLGASSVEQLWITDIYGFLLAGFLITMGTLGDRIGRKKLLLIGAAAFGAASVVAAYSTSPAMLIASRAVLGVAGAILTPSTISLIRTLFRDPKQMGLAIGLWGTCFSAGAVIGPVIGGAMLTQFWWGSVFLLGVPAMVLLLVAGPFLLPEYRASDAGKLDLTSVALSLAAILPVIYGLKELAKNGWQVLPVAGIVIGLAFAVLFVGRQQRLEHPLLDLRLFASRPFSTALGGQMFGTLLMGAIMLFITRDLQLVEGLSPFAAGLWMMPAIVANTVSFIVSPILARRFRPAYVIGAGLAISVSGLIVLTQTDTTSGPTTLVTGFALIFLGAGPLVTLSIHLIMASAPPEKAGSAGALNETSGQFGFAFGLAALGSIGAAVYNNLFTPPNGVPAEAADAARESLADAVVAAKDLPADQARALLAPAREAFVSGLHLVAAISAAILAVVAVLIVRLLRDVPPTGTQSDGEDNEKEERVQVD
ncbi:MFS transporter, DHA2 family, multidrug resistance protein [Actinopolyspora lacussalsi subsp. righensis]|uniref:MFS transporter, DHA2 family, multidrug resistance protein n=1 Tax=Actinopolyspora righensis TaxID=995060 RepID=A0A1I6XD61_9ACTN|nr:MFS transporter [Actinopolyspora righensis]SFT36250.1 MFS transporter, DHA2 family, multidrug resistance protein [Actinopolyspora righensis]